MKIFRILVMLFLLSGCRNSTTVLNIEKDGMRYHYSENLSFYYPRDWEVHESETKVSVDILNKQGYEALFLDSYEIDSSNTEEDMFTLYLQQLSNFGMEVKESGKGELSNGSPCYFAMGINEDDGTKFYEVTEYRSMIQYTYTYIADSDIYDEKIDVMKMYLYSLNVNVML